MPKINRTYANADAIETAFYEAIARADLDALMALWADEDEIVCVHPGAPRLIGHAAIRASWEAIFAGGGGVHIVPRQMHAMQSTMTATHNLIEEIGNQDGMQADDAGQQQRHLVATNVYLKTPAGWRIIVHHASVAPGPAPADPASSSTLH